tara:strand:+ start:666 stop:995 length:330 start_codon:yes stop_codon:yes gene_type:complete
MVQSFLMLLVISTLLVFATIFGLARADSYTEAVTGHVITQEIQNNDMDHSAVANAELNRQMHQLSLQILAVVFDNMPDILDGISAQMRLEADKMYKCSLQDDYKNKECK